MSDREDGRREQEGGRDRLREQESGRDRRTSDSADGGDGEEDRDGGWGLSLPPIRLPRVVSLPFRLPIPRRPRSPPTRRRLLAVALVVDAVDAVLALQVGTSGQYARALAVVVAALVLVGRRGVLAGWEVAAVAAGVPITGVVPTLTALAGLDLVGLGHPEEVQGDAEREGEPPDQRE
jgi:hypothetical protein